MPSAASVNSTCNSKPSLSVTKQSEASSAFSDRNEKNSLGKVRRPQCLVGSGSRFGRLGDTRGGKPLLSVTSCTRLVSSRKLGLPETFVLRTALCPDTPIRASAPEHLCSVH